jgi:hypothetical protein
MNDRFVWVYVVPLASAALPGLQFIFGYTSDGPLSWPAGLVTAFWLWVASEPAGASNIGIGVVLLLAIPVLCLGLPLAALAAARSDGDSRRPTRG